MDENRSGELTKSAKTGVRRRPFRARAQVAAIRVGGVAAAATSVWLGIAACGDATHTETSSTSEQAWVGEGVDAAPTAWWWAVEQTGDQVASLLQQHNARLTSLQVTNGTSPPLFTVTMVPNTGAYAKQWWWFPDISMTQLMTNAKIVDARVVNMDSWVVNGVTHHAAILIANKGMDVSQWWAVDDMSGSDLSTFISTHKARLVDWRQYTKNGVVQNAGILVSNTGAGQVGWWFYPGLTDAQVHANLTTNNAMLVSLQIADPNAGTFNVVMIQNPNPSIPPASWWWGKTDAQIHSLINPNSMRMVDTKTYRVKGTLLYTTIVAPNFAYSGTSASEATCDANVLAGWNSSPPAVGLGSTSTAAAFDQQVLQFMQQYSLPGGAIGVVRNGQLVLARGYGYADRAGAQIAHPDNLFRLASLSKGITSAAILVAEQQGLLSLDGSRPFQILGFTPNPAATTQNPVAPQLNSITVRDLLNHTGGFSREGGCTIQVSSAAPANDQPLNGSSCGSTGDPMAAQLVNIEGLSGNSTPPTCDQIVQYMMTQPMKWNPGAVMDYSNFGYCVLQATLEKVTGTSYATWVANNVLNPAGAGNGIVPGHTTDILDHEVTYYDLPTNYPITSIFDSKGLCQNSGQPNANGMCVPVPYGGAGPYSTGDVEAALAEGGWTSTAVDLLRLQVAKDGRSGSKAILSDASISSLESFPDVWSEGVDAATNVLVLNPPNPGFYYGFGFNIQPNESWQNVGGMAGTITHEYRGGPSSRTDSASGFGWVALFNGSPNDPKNTVGSQIGSMMSTAFGNAGGASAAWLGENLFDQYGVYSNWMTGSQYQTYFNTQAANGLYPSRIEGKNLTGTPMFRAYFAPFHGNNWSSQHGMDCLTYQQKSQSFASQGYATASLQSYVGSDGLRRYQATWIKW